MYIDIDLMSTLTYVLLDFNTTDINEWRDGKFDLIQYGGDPQARENLTTYHQIGSLSWPVLIMFGPSGTVRNLTAAGESPVVIPEIAAKLSCLRAKEAVAGSIVPGYGGTNAGNGFRASISSGKLVVVATLLGICGNAIF